MNFRTLISRYASLPRTQISIIAAGAIVGLSSILILQSESQQTHLVGTHGVYADLECDGELVGTSCQDGAGSCQDLGSGTCTQVANCSSLSDETGCDNAGSLCQRDNEAFECLVAGGSCGSTEATCSGSLCSREVELDCQLDGDTTTACDEYGTNPSESCGRDGAAYQGTTATAGTCSGDGSCSTLTEEADCDENFELEGVACTREGYLCECGPTCGNNIQETGEECDGSDLGTASDCTDIDASTTGPLSCTSGCVYDQSQCTITPVDVTYCDVDGDDVYAPYDNNALPVGIDICAPTSNNNPGTGTDCDDTNANMYPGNTAESAEYTGSVAGGSDFQLFCDDGIDNDCDEAIDPSDPECNATALCGNGAINPGGNEECDGSIPSGVTCETVQGVGSTGTPACIECLLTQGTCTEVAVTTYYCDADDDGAYSGYNAPIHGVFNCTTSLPSAPIDDCNDDPLVGGELQSTEFTEICGDSIDNDCDDVIDNDCVDCNLINETVFIYEFQETCDEASPIVLSGEFLQASPLELDSLTFSNPFFSVTPPTGTQPTSPITRTNSETNVGSLEVSEVFLSPGAPAGTYTGSITVGVADVNTPSIVNYCTFDASNTATVEACSCTDEFEFTGISTLCDTNDGNIINVSVFHTGSSSSLNIDGDITYSLLSTDGGSDIIINDSNNPYTFTQIPAGVYSLDISYTQTNGGSCVTSSVLPSFTFEECTDTTCSDFEDNHTVVVTSDDYDCSAEDNGGNITGTVYNGTNANSTISYEIINTDTTTTVQSVDNYTLQTGLNPILYSGLPAGNYTFSISDGDTCSESQTFIIANDCECSIISPTSTTINNSPSCDANDGEIEIVFGTFNSSVTSVLGSLQKNTGTSQTFSDQSLLVTNNTITYSNLGLGTGEYTLSVSRDEPGFGSCTTVDTNFTIASSTDCNSVGCFAAGNEPTVNVTVSSSEICGNANGVIVVGFSDPSGGDLTPQTFSLNSTPGTSTNSLSSTFTNLTAENTDYVGTIEYTGLDGSTCTAQGSVLLTNDISDCTDTCSDPAGYTGPDLSLYNEGVSAGTLASVTTSSDYHIVHFGRVNCGKIPLGLSELYDSALSQSELCSYTHFMYGGGDLTRDTFQSDLETTSHTALSAEAVAYYTQHAYQGDFQNPGGVVPETFDITSVDFEESVYEGSAILVLDSAGNVVFGPYTSASDGGMDIITTFCSQTCDSTTIDQTANANCQLQEPGFTSQCYNDSVEQSSCNVTLQCYPDLDGDFSPVNSPFAADAGSCQCPNGSVDVYQYDQLSFANGLDCDDTDHTVQGGSCVETLCDDLIDNDGNGDIDCTDEACTYEVVCGGDGDPQVYCDYDNDSLVGTLCEGSLNECATACTTDGCCSVLETPPTSADNCPSISNSDQADNDNDGVGDACDDDDDNDGIDDTSDVCGTSSVDCSQDFDNDTTSDATDSCPADATDQCDSSSSTDSDSDGVDDTTDNCPSTFNPNQENNDGDSLGDSCDDDDDNDSINDETDNCNSIANVVQDDHDNDSLGDLCDDDDDNDGVADTTDNCPLVSNSSQTDSDGDGTGDACDTSGSTDDACAVTVVLDDDKGTACDTDTDNDGIGDEYEDNCPALYNPEQTDTDGDGDGDACDVNADGDSYPDTIDRCPTLVTTDNNDLDDDGTGDACDTDQDNDGLEDTVEDASPNNGDFNGDGVTDSRQTITSSLVNPLSNDYTAIDMKNSNTCSVTQFGVLDEDTLSIADSAYEYPLGLNDFTIDCGEIGATATIRFIYEGVYDTTDWEFRKYLASSDSYIDLSSIVTFSIETIGTTQVTVASYEVTDGGPYDTDGVANGSISDPAGPSIPDPDEIIDEIIATSKGRASSIEIGVNACLSGYELINNLCKKIETSSSSSNNSSTSSSSSSTNSSTSITSSTSTIDPLHSSPYAGTALTYITQRLQSSIKKINDACEGDPAQGNNRIKRLRDVSRNDRTRAPYIVSLYCITSGYRQGFNDTALTSIGEAIKMVAKSHAIINNTTIGTYRAVPYNDVASSAWYADYVSYAYQQGILDGVTTTHRNTRELKALTPISADQLKLLINNAGGTAGVSTEGDDLIHQFTALLHGAAGSTTITREDTAQMLIDAFPEIFEDSTIMVGNNLQVYRIILSQLQQKSQSMQGRYLESMIEKLQGVDSRVFGEELDIDVDVIIELLESGLEESE